MYISIFLSSIFLFLTILLKCYIVIFFALNIVYKQISLQYYVALSSLCCKITRIKSFVVNRICQINIKLYFAYLPTHSCLYLFWVFIFISCLFCTCVLVCTSLVYFVVYLVLISVDTNTHTHIYI